MVSENGVDLTEDREPQPSGCGRMIRFLIRLLLLMVIIIGLGAGAYFGVPAFYRSVIEPMQDNSQRIAELETVLSQEQVSLQNQASQVGERLLEMEGRSAMQAEAIAALQADIDSLRNAQANQEGELAILRDLTDDVENLSSELGRTIDQLEELETSLSEIEVPARRLGRQLQLTQAMILLTRSRLWLVQDNLGLATADVEAARDLFTEVAQTGSEEEVSALEPVIERVDLALEDLRTAPVVAADELEIAWKLLVVLIGPQPVQTATPVATPTEVSNE